MLANFKRLRVNLDERIRKDKQLLQQLPLAATVSFACVTELPKLATQYLQECQRVQAQ